MKIENPTLKTIKYRNTKLSILLLLLIFLNSGCKFSYDDISLGTYTSSTDEIRDFPKDDYGYVIYDVELRKIVKGHNINKEFIPASVTKLFTALFAAETLGTDYTFTTTVSYNGKISDNIISGDLFLEGTGDPELSIDGLQTLVSGINEKKIKEVRGNFYYDQSAFTSRDMLDKDMPADAFYNAGISALTFNSNIIYAIQRRNSEGKITSADFLPSLPSFNSYIYKESLPYPFLKFNYLNGKETWGLPDKNLWDARQPLPVKQPGLFTAQTFRKLCNIRGIKLPLPQNGRTSPSSKIISVHKSKPLAEILKNMLFTSNNMTAELIYTISSAEYCSKEHKNLKETKAMQDFYSSNFTGMKWNNFRIENASGLTDLNRATPEQTTAVLMYIDKMKKENFNLEEILPLSGWDGTMKNRLDKPESAFRVYGKTGSIFYASGLAGAFYAKSGKRFLFTVYINNSTKRSEYNAKKDKTADDINFAGSWTKKAASSIDGFIQKMVEEL